MDMHDLIEELKNLFEKIHSGKASLGEMEAFTAASQQIHERAVVLRYKAYEAKVFGTDLSKETIETVQDIAEDGILDATIDTELVKEHLTFNFESETTESLSFDLFEKEAIAPSELTETNESIDSEKKETTSELDVPNTNSLDESASEKITEPDFSEPKTIEEKKEDVPLFLNHGELHPIYTKLPQDMNSLSARILSVRLESLKGAFGFNERMLIVQELFGGLSEEFSKIVDELDAIPEKSNARARVSEIANRFNWKLDSDIAIDFIQKVERKYA